MPTLRYEGALCFCSWRSNDLLRRSISLVCRNGVPTSDHFDHKTVQLVAKCIRCSDRTSEFVIVDHVLEQ